MTSIMDYLTIELIFCVIVTLVICHLIGLSKTRFLGSLTVCLTLTGVTFYLTDDPISSLLILGLFGLLSVRDSFRVSI